MLSSTSLDCDEGLIRRICMPNSPCKAILECSLERDHRHL